jgi:serine protease Do
MRKIVFLGFAFVLFCSLRAGAAGLPDTITRVKPSVVAVGVFKPTDNPSFTFRGTGFVVGTGNFVATKAHVIPESLDAGGMATLTIRAAVAPAAPQFRPAKLVALDRDHDLALLSIGEAPLPALTLRGIEGVREGSTVAFTGFPIGGVLGFTPVTHRGIVSAITPIALPGVTGQQLSAKSILRLRSGSFDILQLDATAYPGSSGSPVYDIDSGEVIAIINMVLVKGTREDALSHPSGITYAIPATFLRELLRTAGERSGQNEK